MFKNASPVVSFASAPPGPAVYSRELTPSPTEEIEQTGAIAVQVSIA